MTDIAASPSRASLLIRVALVALALVPLQCHAGTLPRILTGPSAGSAPHLKGFEYARGTFTPIASLFAYDVSYTGGVSVAAGDINNDGVPDMIVGSATSSSHVRVLDGQTQAQIHSFFAFPSFTGGVNVAAGDVNSDGTSDIIVSAASGGAHVKVFDGATLSVLGSFFPYVLSYSGGVNVASGDVNNDGLADIITGTASASTHVKVFLAPAFSESASFLAFASATTGVYVAGGDVNGDGYADIITGAGAGAGPHVKVFNGNTQGELASFFAYSLSVSSGVRVASADLDDDGEAEIITSLGSGSDLVRVYSAAAALVDEFNAYGNASVGVFVAAFFTPGSLCEYALDSSGAPADAAGGTGSIGITASPGCSWTAFTSDPWISLNPSGGTGNGSVTWTASSNPDTTPRTGIVQIAGFHFTVIQAAAPVLPATSFNGIQKIHIVTSGGGYQELIFNYNTSETSVTPYANTPGLVSYNLPGGQWVGIYHYDYATQAFTQALYGTKQPL